LNQFPDFLNYNFRVVYRLRKRKTGWGKFRSCAVICTLWETWEQYENYKQVSLCRRTVY